RGGQFYGEQYPPHSDPKNNPSGWRVYDRAWLAPVAHAGSMGAAGHSRWGWRRASGRRSPRGSSARAGSAPSERARTWSDGSPARLRQSWSAYRRHAHLDCAVQSDSRFSPALLPRTILSLCTNLWIKLLLVELLELLTVLGIHIGLQRPAVLPTRNVWIG